MLGSTSVSYLRRLLNHMVECFGTWEWREARCAVEPYEPDC
jgi:hypothetical protein